MKDSNAALEKGLLAAQDSDKAHLSISARSDKETRIRTTQYGMTLHSAMKQKITRFCNAESLHHRNLQNAEETSFNCVQHQSVRFYWRKSHTFIGSRSRINVDTQMPTLMVNVSMQLGRTINAALIKTLMVSNYQWSYIVMKVSPAAAAVWEKAQRDRHRRCCHPGS
jgi:hypothetical protein